MKKKVLIMLLILSLVLVAAFGLVACDFTGKKPSKEEEKTPAVKLQLGELSYNEETRVVSWDKIENVREYELTVKRGQYIINRYRFENNIASHTLDIEQSGIYTVSLQAMGDNRNYKDSDIVSKDINYIAPTVSDAAVKLQAPQNLKYSLTTQLVSWDSVQNALRYEITINGRVYYTEKTTFDMSTRTDSMYTLYVKAIGDNVKYLHSDTSSITFEKETIVEKVPLGIVKKIFVEDAEEEYGLKIISWSRCNDADGYELVINNRSFYRDDIENNIYSFRGEPGHYEVKVRAIANEENEKYISGEYTVLEGGFDILPPPPPTFEDAMAKLDEKIESALRAGYNLAKPKYDILLGIDTTTNKAYFKYNRGTANYLGIADLQGISNSNTVEELNTFVDNLELTVEDIYRSNAVLMSQEDANTLVTNALNKGHVANLQGYTFDNVKWCVATNLNDNVTSITVVTKDNHIVTYDLYIQNNTVESYVQDEGHEVRNEHIYDYTELSDRFQKQQA